MKSLVQGHTVSDSQGSDPGSQQLELLHLTLCVKEGDLQWLGRGQVRAFVLADLRLVRCLVLMRGTDEVRIMERGAEPNCPRFPSRSADANVLFGTREEFRSLSWFGHWIM